MVLVEEGDGVAPADTEALEGAGATVTARGWTLAGVGNWRGYVPASTVYYPAGREAEARQLAADLGVSAVAPAPAGINRQRLTLIVVAPVT
ncbi:LytR C-terminal domain-containing protein [Aeromicrobium sp. REDSEA-S32_B7]|uniref:LytR C-terminal domain-containing protein n=1 Tax=Aeromicrobium sp. REDSEA-S32_B7 TaxID=1811526 RepID=UPI000A9A429F|nr:LytR C-terminal domain-containing protein [Aeromicrobium sp. REDSEA-S32_B7]